MDVFMILTQRAHDIYKCYDNKHKCLEEFRNKRGNSKETNSSICMCYSPSIVSLLDLLTV